jgi:hypothetical protein
VNISSSTRIAQPDVRRVCNVPLHVPGGQPAAESLRQATGHISVTPRLVPSRTQNPSPLLDHAKDGPAAFFPSPPVKRLHESGRLGLTAPIISLLPKLRAIGQRHWSGASGTDALEETKSGMSKSNMHMHVHMPRRGGSEYRRVWSGKIPTCQARAPQGSGRWINDTQKSQSKHVLRPDPWRQYRCAS